MTARSPDFYDLRRPTKRSAEATLRRYVIERHLRSGVKAQDLSGDLAAQPRLTPEEWVTVSQLCRGVPEETLQLLDILWCQQAGTRPRMQYIEAQGGFEVVESWEAKPHTTSQAAERLGISTAAAHLLVGHAIDQVQANIEAMRERSE